MFYPQCNDCMCKTCSKSDCAAHECGLCERLTSGFEPPRGYPNAYCTYHEPKVNERDTACVCCGAEIPPGSLCCPNCLVTHIKPSATRRHKHGERS